MVLLPHDFLTKYCNIHYHNKNIECTNIYKAVPYSLIKSYNTKTQNNESNLSAYTFKVLKDKNTGIIDFRSFSNLDKFKIFLDSTFTIIKKENIGNLIIDIRKNGGGNSVLGNELFQYISPVPFEQFGKVIVKISDTGIKTYDEEELKKLRKNNLRFHGNVYLLISHNTFSSAAVFSWAFNYFKMGKVIGEETGGLNVCYGDIIRISLPHTKLKCTVSFKKFYNYGATDEDIHGTIPDYNVEAEKALDYALKLIEEGK